MKRGLQALTIAIIVGYWIYSIWAGLLRPGAGHMPDSVADIALFVCIKTVIAATVISFLLRANDERWAELGFSPGFLASSLLRGSVFAIGLFLLLNVVVGSLLASLTPGGGSEAIRVLFRDPRQAPLWIFAGIVGGGFTEELIRAFVLTRFDKASGKLGLAFAIVADSVVFGIGHSYQGPDGIVKTGLTGLLFAFIFLQRRRVTDAMVTHAGFDILGIAAAYVLYSRAA